MATGFYTVLVLPDAASAPRKLHIGKTTIAGLASFVALTAMAFCFFLYQYVNLNVRMLELRQLRQEARKHHALGEKIRQLEGDLARVRDLDRRLRVVVGLDQSEGLSVPLAQGGADAGGPNGLREAVANRTGGLVDWGVGELAALAQEIVSREQSMRELKTYLDEKTAVLAATPTILPSQGLVTAGYGHRRSPFTGKREFHEGMDIAAPVGTPIVATADGIVTFAGFAGSYGNVVFIDHGHGFATAYAHNSSNRVRVRQRVRRGEVIAYVGNTGRTTGPHVHYEVHANGVAANPLTYAVDPSSQSFAAVAKAENPS
jgi:murein DD-endopeptidase MepM/ murein hydrolase activator NlpD